MKKTMFLLLVLLFAFAALLCASTPTPTPTIVYSGKVYFQPTPASGKITVVPAVTVLNPGRNITTIFIDSLANTASGTYLRIYDGSVLLRYISTAGWTFPWAIDMYGIKANSAAVDYVTNTGTSTTRTQ
jgi:hypothetical protein